VIPDFYGVEVDLGDQATTTAAELNWIETSISGDYPARMRMVIDNDQATAQTSLFYGFRAQNYGTATNERLVWEAESMNYQPGTAVVTAGASGGTATGQLVSTSATYENLVGHTSFQLCGHYHVFARTFATTAGTSWVRFQWAVNGNAQTNNREAQIVNAATTFSIVDLGGVMVKRPPLGSLNWEGYITARNSTGNRIIRVDKVWFVPADESSGVIKSSALAASSSAQLRTEGYFRASGANYYERPIYGDLPRLPVPTAGTAGTVEVLLKASRGTIGDSTGVVATSDAGIDDISARIFYRPSWLFVGDI
jgi:hypothetical protein